MKILLKRKFNKGDFTEGKLFVNGQFECYTVEDRDRHLENAGIKIDGKTAIPKGTYKVTISMSTRFKKFLIEVLNVPQFKGVRIHSGNSSKDTEGCIIVGSVNNSDNDDWVGGSKTAYEALHNKVKKALSNNEEVWIEVA